MPELKRVRFGLAASDLGFASEFRISAPDFAARHFVQPDHLQQPFARGVFLFVDQRAVPGELVGAPPDEPHQAEADQQRPRRRAHEPIDGQRRPAASGRANTAARSVPSSIEIRPIKHRRHHEHRQDECIRPG